MLTDSLRPPIRSTLRFDEETRAHVQARLRLMTGTVAALTGALWLVFVVVKIASGSPPLGVLQDYLFEFPNAVLSFLVIVASSLHLVLRFARPTPRWLTAIDAVFLLACFAPCILLFHLLPTFAFSGYPVVVPFLMLFILTRAVLVPGGPWTTLLLSLPAPLAVLWSQLAHGATYARPEDPYSASHFSDMLVQNQVLLFGAIAVAMTASWVNLGLRRARFDAKRIGQYELLAPLGSGAMGEVFEATHALLKRPTAIKMLHPERAGRAAVQRFELEVRQTSRLRHPNTVVVYDFGHTAQGVFYYAMELLRGANLRRVVEVTGPMPPARVVHVLECLCAALHEAHRLGLVHRDVKPENVMLCEQGGEADVVKLLDFGLVREIGTGGALEIAGTPETMAPEVARGEQPRAASDLYSLAVTGWYLLSAERLFDGTSASTVLRRHQEEAPALDRLAPVAAPDLVAVLERALRKEPRERFADAHAMREALLSCEAAGRWGALEGEQWWSAHRDALLGEANSGEDVGSREHDPLAATTLLDEATPPRG